MKYAFEKRIVASVFFTAVLITLGGCIAASKLINTGSSAISIKAWVIVKSAEQIGGTQNQGCRLTIQEMTEIIEQLQSSSSMYGTNIQILWDGTIDRVQDNFLDDRGGQPAATFADDWLRAVQEVDINDGPSFEPTAINIYFGGDYHVESIPPPNVFINGMTFDPASGSTFPAIILNDGGEDNMQGSNPQSLRDRQTLEHEMTHYLARFQNRTFGNALTDTLRSYDANEHVDFASQDFGAAVNILLLGDNIQPPYQTRGIPGEAYIDSQNPGQDELGEISQRILQGRWNLGP